MQIDYIAAIEDVLEEVDLDFTNTLLNDLSKLNKQTWNTTQEELIAEAEKQGYTVPELEAEVALQQRKKR